MLFELKFVGTELEKVHNALVFFFNKLKESPQEFSEDLFPKYFRDYLYKYKNPEKGFRNYVDIFRKVYNIYNSPALSVEQKMTLISQFQESNKIEEICNNIDCSPTHFKDIDKIFKDVISSFLTLYDELSNIINRDIHFDSFKTENGKICAICGLETIYQYDHYFPKGEKNPIYPFSAINPHNLVPICQKCNGSKSSKIILFEDYNPVSGRVQVFFPYSPFETWQNLNFKIAYTELPSVSRFGKWKISITVMDGTEDSTRNKINRWMHFFEIEDRYSKDLPTNINIWLDGFKQRKISLEEMLEESKPSKFNVRRTNSIILQWLFFDILIRDQNLKELFISEKSMSENPNDLLMELPA